MNKHGCLCSSILILLHNHPFICGRGKRGTFMQALVRMQARKSEQRWIRGSVKSKVARVGIYDRGAPASLEYGEQAQAGMVTYTRETCSKFSHEVSSGRLAPFLSAAPDSARHLHPFRRHPRSVDRGGEDLSSLAGPGVAAHDEKRDGKTLGARRGRVNFSGGCSAASRLGFSGHWDLSPARATSPPRGAADLRYWFSGGKQNRGASTIFHWLPSGREGEKGWQGEKQDDSFHPVPPPFPASPFLPRTRYFSLYRDRSYMILFHL